MHELRLTVKPYLRILSFFSFTGAKDLLLLPSLASPFLSALQRICREVDDFADAIDVDVKLPCSQEKHPET